MTSTSPAPPETRHTWVPYVGAVAGAALLLKAVLIVGSGNAVGDGPMAVLYLLGVLLGVVAAVGAGLRRDRIGTRIATAAGGALLLLAWITGLGDGLKPLVALASDAEHVQVETPIGLAGAVLLGLSWWGFTRDTRRPADEPALV
jgi:hypothetical protein